MKTLLTYLLLFCSLSAYCQSLGIDSTRFITGNRCCTQISYAIPTADKGILFVGRESNNPGGIIPPFPLDESSHSNVLIGKIDSTHHISWLKVYGGSNDDEATSACQTPDGGYAILAETFSNDGNISENKGGNDIWLFRIDGSGNLLWSKTYGSAESDEPVSVANTPDSGFIILGTSNGSDGDLPFHYGGFFSMDWLVIKTDKIGNKQWSRDIGGTGNEQISGSILSVDSSYYIVSSTDSRDYDCTDTVWHSGLYTYDDYHILKLNDTGKVLWDSSYGGSQNDVINYAFFDVRDSAILITGYTSSNDDMVTGYNGGEGDMWAIKVNKNGTLIWEKAIGTAGAENGTSICAAPGSGYMAYGGATGYIGQGDAWIVNLDKNGNKIADKIFGGTDRDYSTSILPYLQGFAVTGSSSSLVFTEGSTYGNFDGGGPFISYIDYWPLAVNNVNNSPGYAVKIYPNPSSRQVSLQIADNEPGIIKIINSIGQVVYEQKRERQQKDVDIDIAGWNTGIYCILWQDEDGMMLTEKLIKN